MPPVHVFVAYADGYIGKQLIKQFNNKPHLFTLHGCTWDEESVETLMWGDNGGSSIGSAENASKWNGVAFSPSSVASPAAGGGGGGSSSAANMNSINNRRGGPDDVHTTNPPSHAGSLRHDEEQPFQLMQQQQQQLLPHSTAQFFWRRDISAVQEALLTCDWIIVEQRQAQEVFDILSFLQQSTFTHPKRFVLLSSFMTWFATPQLAPPEDMLAQDEENEEYDQDAAEEDEELGAAFPPPPEEVKEEEEIPDEDLDKDPADDEDEDAGDAEEVEVLTEDQYNRRVPHIKYYNWRDAERAVAAAHHANGLPLETFVVFAGLPYGEGGGLLEPFLRQTWSNSTGSFALLPVFGAGTQRVPMIHVRDLATFTRKLLRCPSDELPNPSARYLFATDGANLSWSSIIATVSKMFGGPRLATCGVATTLKTIPAEEFPLFANVEQFIVNLRVDNDTASTLMAREDADADEGITAPTASSHGEPAPLPVHRDSDGRGSSAWIAEGGLKKNWSKVALEFRAVHGVAPLRLAFVGPPMAGKSFVAARVAEYYKLPCFNVEDVLAEYKGALQARKDALLEYKNVLIEQETQRRMDIKKRRILRAERRAAAEAAEHDADEEDGDDEEGFDETVSPEGQQQQGEKSKRPKENPEDDDVEEREEREFELTEDELREAEELMTERFENSARVDAWRAEIAKMERVLLMRTRPRAATPDANPKRRSNQPKKKLTKEQQRKREEEELVLAKEAMKDAPFQDKAIALMLRWRLARPDCRNQGFVLDGFPGTVALARLTFGSEELAAPRTEEEAINASPVQNRFKLPVRDGDEEEEEVLPEELCDEWRLPDHIFLLEADENYLLDRLTAAARVLQQHQQQRQRQQDGEESPSLEAMDGALGKNTGLPIASATPTAATVANGVSVASSTTAGSVVTASQPAHATALENFHAQMATFTQEFIEADFSLLSFFECAVTAPGSVTVGGRRPEAHLINVENEPLVPPPRPASRFEVVPPCATELAVREYAGVSHNFGKTPLEVHQEEVRQQMLREEQRQAQLAEEEATRAAEEAAFKAESAARSHVGAKLARAQQADFDALEARKAPLREYLLKNVVPLLSKGLVEVCQRRPEDPVDFLSEWLLRHNPHDDVFSDL